MEIYIQSSYAHELPININLYDGYEFSYGGTKIINFMNFFFHENKEPNQKFKIVFSPDNLSSKIYVATSAGAIFLGMALLNIISDYSLNSSIINIITTASTYAPKNSSMFYYFSLATIQKEFFSTVIKYLPIEYQKITIQDVVNRLGMAHKPNFMYYKFNKTEACGENMTVIDAIQKSSDIMGIRDGGFSQILPGFQPIYKFPKFLLFSVTDHYTSLAENHDKIYLK